MALLAYNKSGAALALAAGNPIITLPAAGGAVDVTVSLTGLTGPNYAALEAQRVAGGTKVRYKWTKDVEFATGTLKIEESHEDLEVADLATLTNLDDADVPDASECLVLSLGQYFRLDKSYAGAADGITVIAASVGKWIRLIAPVPKWTDQAVWYVNPAAATEEGDGSVGNPLKSLAEFCRRVVRWNASATAPYYTINLLGTIPTTDSFRPTGEVFPSTVAASVNSVMLRLIGATSNALAGGIVGAGGYTSTVGNAQAVLDLGTPAGPYIGKIVKMVGTGGRSANAYGVITASLGGNLAQVSDLATMNPATVPPTRTLVAAGFPIAGDVFDILDFTSFQASFTSIGTPFFRYQFENLDINGGSAGDFVISTGANFITCRIQKRIAWTALARGTHYVCSFGNAADTLQVQSLGSCAGAVAWLSCGFRKCDLAVLDSSNIILQDCHAEGGYISGYSDQNLPAWGSNTSAGQQIAGNLVLTGTYGYGHFNSTAGKAAIAAKNTLRVRVIGNLYGSGNATYGVTVSESSIVGVVTGKTPTITGVSGDVQLDGLATCFQALEAFGGGLLPAPVPLSTWAQWNAVVVPSVSGFARNVMSYKTGAKIIDLSVTA